MEAVVLQRTDSQVKIDLGGREQPHARCLPHAHKVVAGLTVSTAGLREIGPLL